MTAAGAGHLEGFLAALSGDDAEALYERAPCGYLSTQADGTIVKVNSTFLEMTGYERGELVGRRRFDELLTVGGRIYHETHYAPMLMMQGSAREIALDLRRPAGPPLPVLVNSVVDRAPDGSVTFVRTAVFDATHRREYERELLRATQRAEASEAQARALARTLQQTLMPPAPPAVPHLEIAALYRAAGDGAQVGGDFYDVFPVGDGEWVIAIGDVCGKGVDAAVVTALVRYTLRAATVQDESPAAALRVVNDVLLGHPARRFCTVACVRLRYHGGEWRGAAACAGHPLPSERHRDGRLAPVGRHGTLLGVERELRVGDSPLTLTAGESLLLYTDGVSEGRRGPEFYGDDRLARMWSYDHGSAEADAAALMDDLLAFQDGRVRDDIAIVVLRAPDNPAAAATSSCGGRR